MPNYRSVSPAARREARAECSTRVGGGGRHTWSIQPWVRLPAPRAAGQSNEWCGGGDQPRIVFAPPDRPGGVLLPLRERDQSLLASFLCEINRPAGRHQKGSPVVSGAHCGSHGGQLLRHERLVLKCHADRDRPAIKYDDAVLYCTYYSVLPCKRAVLKAVLVVYIRACMGMGYGGGHGAGACAPRPRVKNGSMGVSFVGVQTTRLPLDSHQPVSRELGSMFSSFSWRD